MPGSDPPADTDPAVADTRSSDDASVSDPSTKTAAKRSVRTGDTLGRYELVEEVGEGGMATVFRARDKELRREVAVKVLFPHLARRPEVVRRFHREARAAAGLEHANILRVYDVGGGEADDPPYIVMELIRGRTLLAEIEQRGPMLSEVAACVGALLADALAAAHAAGIIHRDIKPANVLLAPGGRVLLADFGVARLETEDSLVTRTGALLGTPAYMSPEQAGGDTATARSDLYSLGATLYQLATGSLPYSGSAAKVMASIAAGSYIVPVRRRAAVGPDLSRVIERLMSVDPEARPKSAADVASELRAIARAGGLGEAKDELVSYFADQDAFLATKLPSVVTAVVTAASKAIGESKLPRAMALADRASALAPEDPAVVTLVERVTAGDRSSRRKRVLLAGALGVIVVGGGAAGVMALQGERAAVLPDASIDAAADAPADAAPDAAALVDAAELVDAPVRVARADARVAVAPRIDAAVPVAQLDALVVAPAPIDAALARGAIIVKNDTWCEITIDGISFGQRRNERLAVDAGHHSVTCEQRGRGAWTKPVDVAAGETVTVAGTLLGDFAVTVAIDVAIDGKPYKKGASVTLAAGRHELVAGATKKFIDLRFACTIRGEGEDLGCYP